MSSKEKTVEQMVKNAVEEATKGILADMSLKVQKAFELGAEIGAAKGAEMGARAALEAVEEERRRYRRARHERNLRNTKLLLQHYRSLNSHYANAVWEEAETESEGEETFAEIMELMSTRSYSDEVIVESIQKSSRKTRVIMRHVNKMLEEYRRMCESSGRQSDARAWRIVKALYLDDTKLTAQELAEREHIDKRTVYKYVDAAADELTTLFFGVEGIEKL